MDKALRHQMKMTRYKRRLRNVCLKQSENTKLYAYRSHGKPCSCHICSHSKYDKSERQAAQKEIRNQLTHIL